MKAIALTQGKVAFVDDADYESLARHKWSALKACRSWYAVRTSGRRFFYMHAVVAGTPRGAKTDHINGNGLDNTRLNLRVCSDSQNSNNQTRKRLGCSSQYRGVSWHKGSRKWLAQIKDTGRYKYLGLFESERAAAGAYDAAGIARDPEYFTPNFSASWLAP